jgi:tRNA uridine 5-carboxymethylaminomethyl modification enzyme
VRQQLAAVRPATLGQAARVPGVTPAAVSILLVHLRRHRERGPDAATAGPVGTRGAGDPARNAR